MREHATRMQNNDAQLGIIGDILKYGAWLSKAVTGKTISAHFGYREKNRIVRHRRLSDGIKVTISIYKHLYTEMFPIAEVPMASQNPQSGT